ncbi:uncharacterized protein ACA1_105360 [Acanthamoeba castellanii str. Neff]|uniref:Uncharacterized protein n=1 Tax=Acanthamoeba castellanii (strain ATCC 30010 / Neff) TaxID=1257118 RepID=L8HJC8_ACACF|nr:uncharacterized protein ACA1_105360 [Acanthamoeba castellanii str. Neff]ELR24506.1 hypothetical protein ACA1_105360 [Acanthamoeba castellanii str. Neff]
MHMRASAKHRLAAMDACVRWGGRFCVAFVWAFCAVGYWSVWHYVFIPYMMYTAHDPFHIFILLVFHALVILCLYSYYCAIRTDPGFVLPGYLPPEMEEGRLHSVAEHDDEQAASGDEQSDDGGARGDGDVEMKLLRGSGGARGPSKGKERIRDRDDDGSASDSDADSSCPTATAAAGSDGPRAQQAAIEDLREGFSTPVADPWPTTTPPGLPALVNDDSENEEVDWKRRYELATRKDSDYLSSLVINDGLYIVDGHTQNSASSGNVTRVQGTRLRLQHGLLWAEMQYSSGSSYNRQTGAVWVGRYDRASRVVEWRERGLFHYTGRVVDHHTITGTYRWDVNGATGTFELHLAQPEDHSRRW